MKADELMIGDWCLVEGEINRCGYDLMNKLTHRGNEWKLKPIPLTKEILKANEHNDSNYGIVKFIDGYIYIRGWLGNCELYFGMIKYVHELQHALRLCGLTELAQSFKLEEDKPDLSHSSPKG